MKGFIILAYRSRNQTVRMYEMFRANGIDCRIINTPREADVGCGISVRFEEADLDAARVTAQRGISAAPAGFFHMRPDGKGGYRCVRMQ